MMMKPNVFNLKIKIKQIKKLLCENEQTAQIWPNIDMTDGLG